MTFPYGYKLVPGDRVDVTLSCVVGCDGRYTVDFPDRDATVWFPPGASYIAEVKRALPVTEHSLILTHVDDCTPCLLRLQNVAAPFDAVVDLQWVIAWDDAVIEPVRLGTRWIVIDPETLQPVNATTAPKDES